MTTLEAKPRKVRILNTKLLPSAALLLILLALLFLAGPLIRPADGLQRNGTLITSGNGATNSTAPGGGPQVVIGVGGSTAQTGRLTVGTGGRGMIFIYFVALLISLAAALGMLFTKNWGRVLAIIMGVLYGLMGLVSLLPLLFIRLVGALNPVSLILGIVHLLMAVAVIVLVSIPGKPALAPLTEAAPTSS